MKFETEMEAHDRMIFAQRFSLKAGEPLTVGHLIVEQLFGESTTKYMGRQRDRQRWLETQVTGGFTLCVDYPRTIEIYNDQIWETKMEVVS